jgi:hypothetical protein
MHHWLRSLLITAIALCASAQPVSKSIFKEEDVSKAVSALVYLLTDNTSAEDIEQRKIIHYTADDGQESLVVFFTIEGQGGGGNMYMHYLAVFSCLNFGIDHSGYRPSLVSYANIGGKFYREIQLDTVKVTGKKQDIFIDVDTLEYRRTDGASDPTRPNKARFTVHSVLGADIHELPPPRKSKRP